MGTVHDVRLPLLLSLSLPLHLLQAFIFLVAARATVGAWALGNLVHSIGLLIPSRIRGFLFAFLEFVSAREHLVLLKLIHAHCVAR